LLSSLVAVSAAVAVANLSSEARAASPVSQDAPTVPTLAPMRDGFKWGITHVDVISTFNKLGGLIDQDYDALLRRAQPGIQQQSLEADRDNKKAAIERSYLRFVNPTGYDQTPLRSEYSYKNNEAVLLVERQGKKRFFFFLGSEPGERLWKIYDEIPLADDGALGKTFAEAVARIQGVIGLPGRARAADPNSGLDFPIVDWQDGTTHLRVLDRSRQHIVAVVLEERATVNALPQLRANKADDPFAMDPAIAAATHGGISDPSQNAPTPAPSGSAAKPPKKK
jgi:hypothetical protein